MARVRLLEEAEDDFIKAFVWYSERSHRVADEFDAAFLDITNRIGEHPMMFPSCDEEGYR